VTILENLFVLCIALPSSYTNMIKIDLPEIYTIIKNEEELQTVQNTVCNVTLLDQCHSEWLCVKPYESKLAITKPGVQYFIANTQIGTMAYTVKR
tara:strand:+ start:1126 stop:1410 length:285 start_codon:yes stop_codon:yes gene_type:complete